MRVARCLRLAGVVSIVHIQGWDSTLYVFQAFRIPSLVSRQENFTLSVVFEICENRC